MKLPITIAVALGLHAVAAVGAVTLGHARGTSVVVAVVGNATIDLDDEPQPVVDPIVQEERVAARVSTSVRESSRGAPNAVSVVARTSASATSPDALPAPPPVQTAEPFHFKMTASNAPPGAITRPAVHAETEEVATEADVSERASKVGGSAPVYPPEAVAQGVELGSPLPFEIVVDASGRVVSARALRHAGYGFDEAAAAALRSYRFTPAKRNGHTVAVRMKWTVDFRFN